jgi:dolichyl-phosphate beta-glucosyltransferase
MQKTCIIIPCYNEEERFPQSEFNSFIEGESYHFCFVNDGSKDQTLTMLNGLCKGREEKILIVNQAKNQGKAEAVRTGFIKALEWKNFDYIGYLDADLSTPLLEINSLLTQIDKKPEYFLSFGSRVNLVGTHIERKALRHYLSRIFSTFASILLQFSIYDTQCGAKLMKAELANKVFTEPFISPWLFDIEIFKRTVQAYGLEQAKKRMIEVPLQKWHDKGDSRIKLTHLARIPFELFKIYLKYRKTS